MGISTHILDTSLGLPAPQVEVTLAILQEGDWLDLLTTATDADGRCRQMLPEERALALGTYRLHFATAAYFEAGGLPFLYPFVEIAFAVTEPARHFHIPLLLTANGYTTYRGS